jgi:hypothetical protein
MTTPAERLDELAHLITLAATDLAQWLREQADLAPDGYRPSSRSDGMPHAVGTVSDPTGTAVVQRNQRAERDGIVLRVEIGRITAHLLELAVGVVTVTHGHDPTHSASASPVSAVERLHIAAVALPEASRLPRGLKGCCVPYRGLQLDIWVVCDSIRADLDALRTIVPIVPVYDGLCRGGPTDATWHKPHAKSTPAVTRDGLCEACRKRRDRAEVKQEQEQAA